jgi:putative transposase
VDQEENVLDILMQRRRNKRAAKKFFYKLRKGQCTARGVIATDKLKGIVNLRLTKCENNTV